MASPPPPLHRPRLLAVLPVLLLSLLTTSAPTAQDTGPSGTPDGVVSGGTPAALVASDRVAAMTSPVPGAGPDDVLRVFAAPERPWGRGHRGVDLAAPDGRLVAPAAGTVRFSGAVVGRGVLTLEHADGTLSSFEPVTTDLLPGDVVLAGQDVGRVATGHCRTRCVHWGVRREDAWVVGAARFDRYVDPLLLLGWSGPSVLWPQEREVRAGTR